MTIFFEDYTQSIIEQIGEYHPQTDEGKQTPPQTVNSQPSSLFDDDHQSLYPVYLFERYLNQYPLLHYEFNDEDGGLTRIVGRSLELDGMETIAFYKSLRFKHRPLFAGHWGIFILETGIQTIANLILAHYPGRYNCDEARTKAFWILYYHERYHFRFDAWAFSQESVLISPLYERYYHEVYQVNYPNTLLVEETLANLSALSSVQRHGIQAFTRQFMRAQPGAYGNIKGVDANQLRAQLAAQLMYGAEQITNSSKSEIIAYSQYVACSINTVQLDRQCPVYIVK